jgi:hypothetical protein
MEAWPFLFSKSAGMERKAIAMPEVLRGEDAARLIAHVTAPTLSDGETKAGEALFLREVPHSTLGPLHVVFRNRQATASDLGHAPDGLFPEWVTEGLIARGAEPRFAYSQAHFEAAREVGTAKLRQCEQAVAWGEADALCDLKLQLTTDASSKMNLTGVHGSNGVARRHFTDLRSAWQAEAREETRRAGVVEKATEQTISWGQRVRRALPESSPKRAFLFTAVAGVTLGGSLAWQHWKHRQGQEERSTDLERV